MMGRNVNNVRRCFANRSFSMRSTHLQSE